MRAVGALFVSRLSCCPAFSVEAASLHVVRETVLEAGCRCIVRE